MVGPEALNDGLEGAASPIEMDPQLTPEELAAIEAAQDNRRYSTPYQLRQRTRRMAKTAGISRDEAESMLVPEEEVMANAANVDPQSGLMNARGRAAQYDPLIKAAEDARDAAEAERRKTWQSHMMLASGNARGNMVNAFNMLSDEQKQRVIESRLTGGRNYNNDPRLAIAQMEMQARQSEGAAQRAHLASEGAAQRANARELSDADRKSRADALASQQLLSTQQFQTTQSESAARHTATMTGMQNNFTAQMEALKQASETARTAADQRSADMALGLEKMRAELQSADNRAREVNDTRIKEAEINAQGPKDQLAVALEKMRQGSDEDKKKRQAAFMAQSPGAYHVASGLGDSPEAIEYLKELAANSDQYQWLPGGGFGSREAGAMNAGLLNLARQADMHGIQHRLNDRAYREELIRKYGYASGWSGGRGGWMGDFWQPIPADPMMAP
jgi:hypothetical protein